MTNLQYTDSNRPEAAWPDKMENPEKLMIRKCFSTAPEIPSEKNYTWLADDEKHIFGIGRGMYFDENGSPVEFSRPDPDESDVQKINEEYKRNRAEYIADVCSGLDSFTDFEVEWQIDEGFGHFGFKDLAGNVVIEPQYGWVGEFSHGLCPVNLKRTWYTTPKGKRFFEDHYGYIDTLGKTVIPFRYDEASSFNQYGVAVVSDDSGMYMIDTEGNEIEGTRFPYVDTRIDYNDRYVEIAEIDSDDDYEKNDTGLYDTKFRRIIREPHFQMYCIYDDDSIIETEAVEDRHGDTYERILNSEGKYKYPWQEHRIFARIEMPDKYGNFIGARSTYKETEETPDNELYCFYQNSKTYERRYWYGLMDKDGNTLIPPEYELITYLGSGFYSTYKDKVTTILKIVPRDAE